MSTTATDTVATPPATAGDAAATMPAKGSMTTFEELIYGVWVTVEKPTIGAYVRARDPLVGVMSAEGTYHGIIRSHLTGEAEHLFFDGQINGRPVHCFPLDAGDVPITDPRTVYEIIAARSRREPPA